MGMPEHIECVAPIGCWVLHGAVENFIGNGFACIRLVVTFLAAALEFSLHVRLAWGFWPFFLAVSAEEFCACHWQLRIALPLFGKFCMRLVEIMFGNLRFCAALHQGKFRRCRTLGSANNRKSRAEDIPELYHDEFEEVVDNEPRVQRLQ